MQTGAQPVCGWRRAHVSWFSFILGCVPTVSLTVNTFMLRDLPARLVASVIHVCVPRGGGPSHSLGMAIDFCLGSTIHALLFVLRLSVICQMDKWKTLDCWKGDSHLRVFSFPSTFVIVSFVVFKLPVASHECNGMDSVSCVTLMEIYFRQER